MSWLSKERDMDFSKKIMDSIKAGNLPHLRAVLIGCLDDDEKSQETPQTLALAEEIANELAEKSPSIDLFVADNGHFDFDSASSNQDKLKTIKSRLRMNFSKEKLAFACKIIASLNATSGSITTPISEKRSIDTSAVLQPETKPAPEGVVQESSIRSSKPEPSKGSAVEKDVGTSVKTTEEHKEKTDQPSAKISEMPSVPEPEKPSVPEPEKPSEPESKQPSLEDARLKKSAEKMSLAGSETPGQQSATQEPGYWERKFATVGRRIDEFLKRLFG